HVMGSPIGRLLIRQLNLFVNVMIPVGHRLTKPTGEQMAHYKKALDSPERREGSAVFPREITASRAFLSDIDAGLPDIAALPTLIIWGDADFAFGNTELHRWERTFTDHHTVIVKGAGHFVPSDAPEQFAAAIRDWYPLPGA
ncbi:MAG TPA: alpha/beta hydrolase, partial [Mycobacterium sp.]